MNLQDLKKEMPFKWRVQSTNEYGSNCVAYIDARDVQDILDDVCGAENWQVVYEEHKGNLFAKIGIRQWLSAMDEFTTEDSWIWKSDCGTESQVEKRKDEASDAFKRAAVMWGVGRFLYSKKIIKIKEVIQVGNKYHPAQNGKRIWDINQYCNNLNGNTTQPKAVSTPKPIATPKRLTPEQVDSIPNSTDLKRLQSTLKDYTLQPNEKLAIEKRISELKK